MDVRNWCSSGIRTIQLGRRYDELELESFQATGKLNRSMWDVLKRKLMKEKRKSTSTVHVPYDSYTYSQNFDDQGSMWDEPDNLSRSFSVRFANPASSIFLIRKQ